MGVGIIRESRLCNGFDMALVIACMYECLSISVIAYTPFYICVICKKSKGVKTRRKLYF